MEPAKQDIASFFVSQYGMKWQVIKAIIMVLFPPEAHPTLHSLSSPYPMICLSQSDLVILY